MKRPKISIFGQGLIARRELGRAQHARRVSDSGANQSNPTTWKLANPDSESGRGIEADLGDELRQAEGSRAANADSFHRDLRNIVLF